ncbi:Uncharacterised protein [Mycobacterium tuberculosis]|nr:Uncharacterised protein [Mycobacterium tuberculosis]
MESDLLLASRFSIQVCATDAGNQALIPEHISTPLDLSPFGQLRDIAGYC